MPYGCHIYTKASGMAKGKFCAYPQPDHALPQWKCVMQCCAKCPSIRLPDQETDYQYSGTSPSIRFHIYHIIENCSTHRRLPLNDKKIVANFNRILLQNNPQNIYTIKELVMMETNISDFQ